MSVAIFLTTTVGTIGAIGGLSGFAYVALFILAVLPGFPLGFVLFGRRHPAGWLAGGLFGYATTTLVWWSVIAVGLTSAAAYVLAPAATLGLSWLVAGRGTAPIVALPAWTRRDSAALALVLIMAPVLIGPAFTRLGSTDASGNRRYRAYFIADFVWHAALTSELAKNEPRPRNPFLSSEPLHYYWTYFRVPATLTTAGFDVQEALKVNAFITALLLLAAIFLATWSTAPQHAMPVAAAVMLTTLAASAEGIAGIADVLRRGLPLAELRDLNIDAVAAWGFKGLRIDNLPRTMWYTPQHGFSCALGLLAVTIALADGVRTKPVASLLGGCALGASLAFSPLLGVAFCVVYGLTIVLDAVNRRAPIAAVLAHGIAAIPVALALGWCAWNEVGAGAGQALQIGWYGLARNSPILTFLLQFGPLLLAMAPGLVLGHSPSRPSIWPAIAGVVLAVILMHFLALSVDTAWVGFRSGNLFFVFAPAIVARGLIALRESGRHRLHTATVALALVLGLPTTAIDAFNSQDVENTHLSRDAERDRGATVVFNTSTEFHWTVVITAAQLEALEWIGSHTAKDAVVQMEPTIRGRETWSLVPTFAQRRMATGVAIPLLPVPEYADNNERVEEIYASADPRRAWELSRELDIDYLYVDATERRAYPAVEKFDVHPQYFEPVFSNAEAAVYALRP